MTVSLPGHKQILSFPLPAASAEAVSLAGKLAYDCSTHFIFYILKPYELAAQDSLLFLCWHRQSSELWPPGHKALTEPAGLWTPSRHTWLTSANSAP